MKKRFIVTVILAVVSLFGVTMYAARTGSRQLTSWIVNHGEQMVGYTGMGNQNEPLAFACVTVAQEKISVNYSLQGSTSFIKGLKFYAVPRKSTSSYNSDNTSLPNIEDTFAKLFDSSAPIAKNGAILLGTVTDLSATTFSSDIAVAAGDYLVYLTADIDPIVDNLPLLTVQKTKIGAKIESVNGSAITYTNASNVSTAPYTDGTRTLVPHFKILYMPGEYYSNFYRIPGITKASDGSLIASSDARKLHIHDITNNIDILMRRSTDNGLTWSDPITVMKAEKANADVVDNSQVCTDWKAYGDCAVGALPNGTVVAVAIHGYGLLEPNTQNKTTNHYIVSHDNGKTWGEIKEIPEALYTYKTNTPHRGCIAPGRLTACKGGVLDGKLICCFRGYKTYNGTGADNTGGACNYILIYDPVKDKWSSAQWKSTNIYLINNLNGTDDEAQIIQVGDDEFLMSVRSSGTNNRAFARVNVSYDSAKDCYNIDVNKSTFTGMNLSTACNGGMMNYTAMVDGVKKEYIFHTMPNGNDGGRTGLSLYTTEKPAAGFSSIAWEWNKNLFDPSVTTSSTTDYGYIAETSQYSALVEQQDGTIGIVMEAYPYIMRQKASTEYGNGGGDYVMAQYFMNLRVGDIIAGATPVEKVDLSAPVITPKSEVFDKSDVTDRPTLVIQNNNTVLPTSIKYEMQLIDGQGAIVSSTGEQSCAETSLTMEWTDMLSALGKTEADVDNKSSVRVSAYAQSTNSDDVSRVETEIFRLAPNIRRVKVVAVPTKKAGQIVVQTRGVVAQSDEVIKVEPNAIGELGDRIVINAPANHPYKFVGFYTDEECAAKDNVGSYINLDSESNYTIDNLQGYQVSFNMPKSELVAANDAAGKTLVIYAKYDLSAGVQTMVKTGVTQNSKYTYSWWNPDNDATNTDVVTAKNQDKGADDLSIPTPPQRDNIAGGENFTYSYNNNGGTITGSTQLSFNPAYGLSLYPQIRPDAYMAAEFNAVVAVKQGEEYVTNDNGDIKYYLINGRNHSYLPTSAMSAGAENVLQWYATDAANNTINPLVIGCTTEEGATMSIQSAIAFENVVNPASRAISTDDVNVEFYIVHDDVADINALLSNPESYHFKITHPVVASNLFTGVDGIEVGAFTVQGVQGGVMIAAGEPSQVVINNVLGQAVAVVDVDGSKFVELPQGVYVVAGKKVVVQ